MRIDHERYLFVSNPLLAHRLLALARDEPGDDVPDLWAPGRCGLGGERSPAGSTSPTSAPLRQACEDAGLEVPQRLWARLADPDDHLSETLADRAYAQSIDLDGVPRLRVGGTIVPAWLPLDEVREAFRRSSGRGERVAERILVTGVLGCLGAWVAKCRHRSRRTRSSATTSGATAAGSSSCSEPTSAA